MGKAFEKQIKTIEDQGQKQLEGLEDFKTDKDGEEIESVKGIVPKKGQKLMKLIIS